MSQGSEEARNSVPNVSSFMETFLQLGKNIHENDDTDEVQGFYVVMHSVGDAEKMKKRMVDGSGVTCVVPEEERQTRSYKKAPCKVTAFSFAPPGGNHKSQRAFHDFVFFGKLIEAFQEIQLRDTKSNTEIHIPTAGIKSALNTTKSRICITEWSLETDESEFLNKLRVSNKEDSEGV
jgi:hypothetical protein